MIIVARTSQVPVAPRKLQLLAKAIKAMRPAAAIEQLTYLNRSAAKPLLKTIKQALANAKNNFSLDDSRLTFHSISIDKGLVYHRGHPGPRGRFKPFDVTRSHITVRLESKEAPVKTSTPAATPVKEAKLIAPKPAKKTITKKVATKK